MSHPPFSLSNRALDLPSGLGTPRHSSNLSGFRKMSCLEQGLLRKLTHRGRRARRLHKVPRLAVRKAPGSFFTTISLTASWGVIGKQERLSTYPPYMMPHSFIASTQMILVLQSSVGLGVGTSRGGSLASLVMISQSGTWGGGCLQGLKQLFQTHVSYPVLPFFFLPLDGII